MKALERGSLYSCGATWRQPVRYYSSFILRSAPQLVIQAEHARDSIVHFPVIRPPVPMFGADSKSNSQIPANSYHLDRGIFAGCVVTSDYA